MATGPERPSPPGHLLLDWGIDLGLVLFIVVLLVYPW
jgi:hypothetical protein